MNQFTPKSNNSEVHELRYRISQLEHLVVQNSLNNTNVSNNTSLPSNSYSLLNTQQGLIDRVNELEGLLAASELDNENLKKHLELLNVERNRSEVQLLEKVFRTESDKNDLQHENQLIQIKLAKAQQKLSNIQDYINDLPSQDELDEARKMGLELQEDNQLLEGKLDRMLDNVKSLQKERILLENALQQAELKLEELKPLEEAQQAFLNHGELSPLDLTNVAKVEEFLTLQKAQLLRSSKIISSLREKLCQSESDRADGLIKISNLESDIQSLQEQTVSIQLKIDSLNEKQKILEQDKATLQLDKTALQQEIEQRESNLEQRDHHIHSLIQLVTEIDLSVGDVENLVELGRSLALGEEPSVSTLLGLDDQDLLLNNTTTNFEQDKKNITSSTNSLLLETSSSNNNPNDPEWTLERLVKIRGIRKHLRELRDVASDIYTDMLGGKIEGCSLQ